MDDTTKQEFQKMLNEQTIEVKKYVDTKFNNLNVRISPVVSIYESSIGFSKGMRFIFRNLIVPFSVVIGVLLTFKEFFKSFFLSR